MAPAFIVSLALRILVLAGIGGCITTVRRHASASERHLLWMLTLAAIVVLPIAIALLPGLNLVTLPAVSPDSSTAVSLPNQDTSLWPVAIATVWIIGSVFCALGLLMAHARARQIIRKSSLNCDWSQEIGSPVLVSNEASFAFNYGLIVPVIVLPARAVVWSEELIRATLIHEAAHIARHDGVSLFIAQLTRVIYWWHPAVRYIVREAANERESACDDAVLRVGVSPTVYGEHLLANATLRLSHSVAVAAPLFSHTDRLLPRIAKLLDDRLDHGVVRRRVIYSAAAAALPLLALIASATPVARRISVAAATVVSPPLLAQAPSATTPPRVDSTHKKREWHVDRNVSSKRKRDRGRANPDSVTHVGGKAMQQDFAGAAIFPVDLKKFVKLAGSMGRLAGQMARSIDSAKMGGQR